MPHLLHLDSSADSSVGPLGSISREITAAFATAWTARGDEFTVTYRDLHADPLPHLADAALHWAPRLRLENSSVPAQAEALQQTLLDELDAADVLLVGAPMYNYSLPSSLKAWIDHIHVLGRTAPFDGPTKPHAGKPAVVVSSRGATYDEGSPTSDWDHSVPVLELILGQSLGMSVTTLVAGATLAARVPPMKALVPRADEERNAALTRAAELAAELG